MGLRRLLDLRWDIFRYGHPAANIVAGPGESGFRAAIAAAQDGDTVRLTSPLQLQSTVAINKQITIMADPLEAWRIWIESQFDGAMLELSTNGIVLDGLKMYGSPQTDALHAEGTTAPSRVTRAGRLSSLPPTHTIFFPLCTVADNVVIGSDPLNWLSHAAAFWIGSSARLENCVVADNPNDDDPNASGLVGNWIDVGGNVIGGPAHLSMLRDNGGPTLSLLPLQGSPAIDAGRPSDVVMDARGLSRLAGAAPDAGAIETGAGPLADTDADGIPDVWERLHGLNPEDPADASSDTDGDGQSARAEFGSSTDPADRQSVHRTERCSCRWRYLTWTRYPAVFYHVEVSNDLRNWRRIPDAGSPDGSTLWWNLGLIEANSPNNLYRVIAIK